MHPTVDRVKCCCQRRSIQNETPHSGAVLAWPEQHVQPACLRYKCISLSGEYPSGASSDTGNSVYLACPVGQEGGFLLHDTSCYKRCVCYRLEELFICGETLPSEKTAKHRDDLKPTTLRFADETCTDDRNNALFDKAYTRT